MGALRVNRVRVHKLLLLACQTLVEASRGPVDPLSSRFTAESRTQCCFGDSSWRDAGASQAGD